MIKQTSLLIFLLLSTFIYAQTTTEEIRCGTVKHQQYLKEKYPNQTETTLEFENWLADEIQKRAKENSSSEKGNPVVTIPVVFHVLHSGQPIGPGINLENKYIYANLQQLNNDFRRKVGTSGHNTHPAGADTEIEFCLAVEDPNGNPMPEIGINRINGFASGFGALPYYPQQLDDVIKPATIWDPNRYLNVWITDLAVTLGIGNFPTSSGLPGIPGTPTPGNSDGVVLSYTIVGSTILQQPQGAPVNYGRILSHEVGHFLGLRHTNGDAACGDDFCSDTPQVDYLSYGCPNKSTCDGSQDMVENYMDYTDGNCKNIFTEDQKTRMQTVLAASPRRVSLTTSTVCTGVTPDAPIANFGATNPRSCVFPYTIQFQDASSGFPAASSWNWSFPGGSPSTSTLQNPIVTYNSNGVHDATLIVSNGIGSDTIVLLDYVNINPKGIPTPVLEDFESPFFPPDEWTIYSKDGHSPPFAYSWEHINTVGNNSSSSMHMKFYYFFLNDEIYDDITLPGMDLSNNSNTQLTFDVAYPDPDTYISDTLEILVSVNCGATYTSIYKNFGANLASAPLPSGEFFPSSNEWKQEVIDLSPYDGLPNVSFIFRAHAGAFNNMYIDNINVFENVSTSQDEAQKLSTFEVFPNPTTGIVSVQLQVDQSTDINVRIINSLGQEVINEQQRITGSFSKEYDLRHLALGVYFIQITDGKQTFSKKLTYLK